MGAQSAKFTVLSRTENVQSVGARIDEICEVNGVPADVREDIVVAVDEAMTNIMMHSYQGRDDGAIEITCSCQPGELELSLADSGVSFVMPPLDTLMEWKRKNELVKGGYGLILMHKFMDDVIFLHDKHLGKNIVTMKKRF